MKEGIPPQKLYAEVDRQNGAKQDYVRDTRAMKFIQSDDRLKLHIKDLGHFDVGDYAHQQIADRLRIPMKYYKRMRQDAPDLLTRYVNYWFQNDPDLRMVRTLDGRARAFLSVRYRRMDNSNLLEAVMPTLDSFGAKVHSCNILEERMYLKAVIDGVKKRIPAPKGSRRSGHQLDFIVSPGIVISNSEIGHGALAIQPAVHFLSCLNMAVWAKPVLQKYTLRKYHVGRNIGAGSEGGKLDETKNLTDKELWSQVNDMVKGALQGQVRGDLFKSIVNDLRAARSQPIEQSAVEVTIKNLSKDKNLRKPEEEGVLCYLIKGGDMTKFGLSNAVTQFSQKVANYERASFLERIGGELITLSDQDWKSMTNSPLPTNGRAEQQAVR